MRRLYLLIALLFCCLFSFAQTTTVSLTATDSGGQVWANGTIRYSFQPTPSNPNPAQWQGTALPSVYYATQVVPLNSSGYGTFTVPSNTAITPAGSSWNISICPNVTFNCVTINVAVTGATTDISALVDAAIVKPAVAIQPIPKAYNDSEIQVNPNQGGIYYNTGLIYPGLRYWDGDSFQPLAGSISGSVTSFSAPSANWPTWLTPSVATATSTPSLSVATSPIPNSALQYSSINVNGSAWNLGGSYTLTASATPGGNSGDMQFNNAGAMGGTDNAKLDSNGNITNAGAINTQRIYSTGNDSNCYNNTFGSLYCDFANHAINNRITTSGSESNIGTYSQTTLNGAGSAVTDGGGQTWTVGKGYQLDFFDNVRGIGQAFGINMVTHSISDKAGIYAYTYNDPGCGVVAQDEGCTGMTLQKLQNGNVHQSGTLTGGTSTQPTLSIVGPFTDGGYLSDVSTGGTASAFAGSGSLDNTIHNWTIPVTASSIPLSSAICVSSNNLTDSNNKRTVPVSATVTVTCQAINGSTPNLVPGVAEIAGPSGSYGPPEQVNITAVSGTSVTLSYTLPHATGFTIFQGGVAGDIISVDSDYSFFGYRTTYVALGSRTGSELIFCAVEFSDCNLPLPRTGETTETTTSAIHLFPSAEIIANLNGGGINVEPNTWVSGATSHAIETNPPSFSTGTGEWLADDNDFMCSSYLGGCSGFYDRYGGKHVSSAYSGFIVENHNPCSLYISCDPVNGKLAEPLAAIKVIGYHQYDHYESQPLYGWSYITDSLGTNTDYGYDVIRTNAAGSLFYLENNQTSGTSSSGVPANTSSVQVKTVDFVTPCTHEDRNSNTFFNITCPATYASGDGAGSPDITLNNPTNGSNKYGIVDNTTGGSQFNGPLKVSLTNQPCLSTDSNGKLATCSTNNIQITTTTTAVNANSCTAVTAQAMSNVTTSSTFEFTATSNIGTVTGWGANAGLKLFAYPTAGNINWYVCNQTAAGITPSSAVTWNVSAH